MRNFIRSCIFSVVVLFGSIAFSQEKSCDPFKKSIEQLLVEKKIGKKILSFEDLHQESQDDYRGYKLNEEPGCLCGKIDGKVISCAIILLPLKEKIGPSIYIVKVEKYPYELVKVDDFNTYYGGKQYVFLVPKKKAILENRGKGPDKVFMPNDGIELVNPGKSAFTMFFKGAKIQQVWTSD